MSISKATHPQEFKRAINVAQYNARLRWEESRKSVIKIGFDPTLGKRLHGRKVELLALLQAM